MRRPIGAIVAGLALLPALAPAQLPTIAVPTGTIRFEIGGSFNPANDAWRDGRKMSVGDLLSGSLNAERTPIVGDMSRALTSALGQAAQPATLGTLTTIAQWQRNVGTLGAAWGVSPKLTIFAMLPIVSVRTERQSTFDAANASLGFNPASAALGTSDGRNQTDAFLASLDVALTTLEARIGQGEYSGNTLVVAQQIASSAATFQSALEVLFRQSVVLPLATSGDATALSLKISGLAATLNDQLGISDLVGSPAFPNAALTPTDFDALLAGAVGIRPTSGQPVTGTGRLELGAIIELAHRDATAGGTALSVWGRGLLRLGTGTEASEFELLSQGTGGKAHEIEAGGIVQLSRARKGLRGEMSVILPLPVSAEQRLSTLNEILIPSARSALVSRRHGLGISLAATPYIQIAPHLAVTGMVRYVMQQADHLSYDDALLNRSGLDSDDFSRGTGVSSLGAGLGLSYSHDGRSHDGFVRMPVEAGFSIERTITSGSGLVPSSLTTKVYLRLYKRVAKQQ